MAWCNGVAECSAASDEAGPTCAPTLASASPTVPPPTLSPIPASTAAPTMTPPCPLPCRHLPSCYNSMSTLRRIESGYASPYARCGDSAPCRTCRGGFADVTTFCATTSGPGIVRLRRTRRLFYARNLSPWLYFRVPASSTPSAIAMCIRHPPRAFETLPLHCLELTKTHGRARLGLRARTATA